MGKYFETQDKASKKTWCQKETEKEKGCDMEHWKKEIQDQELVVFFFFFYLPQEITKSILDEKTARS